MTMKTATVSLLTHYQYYPRIADVYHPPHHLPAIINPGLIMRTLRWLAKTLNTPSFKALGLGLGATETELRYSIVILL